MQWLGKAYTRRFDLRLKFEINGLRCFQSVKRISKLDFTNKAQTFLLNLVGWSS